MMRIAFVIIGAHQYSFERVYRRGQKRTWIQDKTENEQVLAVYSDGTLGASTINPECDYRISFEKLTSNKVEITPPKYFKSNCASFAAPSGYGGILYSTISAFKYLMDDFQPDFIVRTNISSFWNLKALRSYLSSVPTTNFYSGVIGSIEGIQYCSGSGIVMSIDVARKLIEKADQLDLTLIDDLSIGKLLSTLEIFPSEGSRLDISRVRQIRKYSSEKLGSYYHIRCKSLLRFKKFKIRRDVRIMRKLYNLLD